MSTSAPTRSICYTIRDSTFFQEYGDVQIASSSAVKNQADLESYNSKLIALTPTQISKQFGCKTSKDSNQLRYFSSTYLALNVIDPLAAKCTNANPPPKLCKNVVEAAAKSLNDFVNLNECSVNSLALRGIRSRMSAFLAKDSNNDTNDCLPGLGQDQKQCGFQKANDASNFCQSNPDDGCCNFAGIETVSSAPSNSKALIIGVSVVGAFVLLIFMAYLIRYRGRFWQSSSSSNNEVKTTFKVFQAYAPQMVDELELNVGNIVIVQKVLDDLWGFGLNITTESEGKFPLTCLAELNTSDSDQISNGIMPTIGTSSLSNNRPEFLKINGNNINVKSVPRKQNDSANLLLQRIYEISQRAMEFLKKYLNILWEYICTTAQIIRKSIIDFMRYLGILWWRYSSVRLQTTFKVVQNHIPNLVDEIALNIGDIVILKEKFDDGWGAGLNITTEQEGSFPVNCISDLKTIDSHTLENGRSVRDSSLIYNSLKKVNAEEQQLFDSVKIKPIVKGTGNNVNTPPVQPKQYDSFKAPESEVNDIYSSIKVQPKEEHKEEKNGTVNEATFKNYSVFYDPFKSKPLRIQTNTPKELPMDPMSETVKLTPITPSQVAGEKYESSFFNPFKSTAVKSPRKFGNHELKYGTAKGLLGISPKSPKSPTSPKIPLRQTFTFNKK